MNIRRWFGILLFGCFILPAGLFAQDEAQNEEFPNKEENALCLKCHGNQVYPMPVDGTGETVLLKMCRGDRIDTVAYYKGNHGTFTCTDCHSYDYTTFPHNPNLRLEQMPSCLDCHDGALMAHEQWLPNAGRHLEVVSCAACHAPQVERRIDLELHDNLARTGQDTGQNLAHQQLQQQLKKLLYRKIAVATHIVVLIYASG